SYGHPGKEAPRSTPRLTQPQTAPARTGGTDLTLESGRAPPLDGRSDTNDPPIDRSLGRSLLRSELTTSEARELLLSEPYPGLANSAPPSMSAVGRSSAVVAQGFRDAKLMPSNRCEISRLSRYRGPFGTATMARASRNETRELVSEEAEEACWRHRDLANDHAEVR